MGIKMYILLLPPPTGERSIAVSVSVCVCLSVHDHYIRNYTSDLHRNFLRLSPLAVARSSSGGVVICYVLLVSWTYG